MTAFMVVIGVIAIMFIYSMFKRKNESSNEVESNDSKVEKLDLESGKVELKYNFPKQLKTKYGRTQTFTIRQKSKTTGGNVNDWVYYDEFGDIITDYLLMTMLYDAFYTDSYQDSGSNYYMEYTPENYNEHSVSSAPINTQEVDTTIHETVVEEPTVVEEVIEEPTFTEPKFTEPTFSEPHFNESSDSDTTKTSHSFDLPSHDHGSSHSHDYGSSHSHDYSSSSSDYSSSSSDYSSSDSGSSFD